MYDHVDTLAARRASGNAIIGIPTGLPGLNSLLSGWNKGRFYTVAGQTGTGKSLVLLNFVLEAIKHDQRVLWLSYEMGVDEIMDRLSAHEMAIDARQIEAGELSVEQREQHTEVVKRLEDKQLFIEDSGTPTANGIRTLARKLARNGGLDMLVVDYLQMVPPGPEATGNRVYEVTHVSRTLKMIAQELKIAVIAAAQLSRKIDDRQLKVPMLSDLRESGSIEQDSDCVLFVYADDYHDEHKKHEPVWNDVKLLVAKQRGGRTGKVTVTMNKQMMQVSENAWRPGREGGVT